jgi:hypothetical protein
VNEEALARVGSQRHSKKKEPKLSHVKTTSLAKPLKRLKYENKRTDEIRGDAVRWIEITPNRVEGEAVFMRK